MEIIEIRNEFATLAVYLVAIARLHAVKSIFQETFEKKLADFSISVRAVGDFEKVSAVLERQFHHKIRFVEWPFGMSEALHHLSEAVLNELIWRVAGESEAACQRLISEGKSSPVLSFILDIAVQIQSNLFSCERPAQYKSTDGLHVHSNTLECVRPTAEFVRSRTGLIRTVRGPKHMKLPAYFITGASVLDSPQATFSDDYIGAIQYLWNRSARESSASALCALTTFEYDGAEPEFYCDFIRQGSDEARHALFYWIEFKSQVPEFTKANHAGAVAEQIYRFQSTGTGLELPREAVFYELFWNTTLVERLCLMNIDTEAVGLRKFANRIKWARTHGFLRLATGLEMDRLDEVFHAKLGRKWLKRVIPHDKTRDSELEVARSLRGFLIYTSVAQAQDTSVIDLINGFSYSSVS